jgi:hypothetical protein
LEIGGELVVVGPEGFQCGEGGAAGGPEVGLAAAEVLVAAAEVGEIPRAGRTVEKFQDLAGLGGAEVIGFEI